MLTLEWMEVIIFGLLKGMACVAAPRRRQRAHCAVSARRRVPLVNNAMSHVRAFETLPQGSRPDERRSENLEDTRASSRPSSPSSTSASEATLSSFIPFFFFPADAALLSLSVSKRSPEAAVAVETARKIPCGRLSRSEARCFVFFSFCLFL